MTDSSGAQAPLLSIALRGGDSLDLFADYLRGRDELLPLIELVWAGPVPDPTAPIAVAGLTPPALGLRLRDGRQRIYVAADPPDTPRMIEAILGQRPDLRFPFPPPPGYGPPAWAPPPPPPGYAAPAWSSAAPFPPPPLQAETAPPPQAETAPPPPPPPGYAPPPPGYAPPPPGYAPPPPGYAPPPPPPGAGGYTMPYAAAYAPSGRGNDTVLAGLSHLSVFFAPVILPLIVWLATRNSSPYASQQAKQAFVFHLIFTGLSLVVGIGGYAVFLSSIFKLNPTDASSITMAPFTGIFLLWGGIGVLGLINTVFSIIGAVHAFQGKPFHYPLLGNL